MMMKATDTLDARTKLSEIHDLLDEREAIEKQIRNARSPTGFRDRGDGTFANDVCYIRVGGVSISSHSNADVYDAILAVMTTKLRMVDDSLRSRGIDMASHSHPVPA